MKCRFTVILLIVFLLVQGQYGYAEELAGVTSAVQELEDMGILELDFLEGPAVLSRGEFTNIAVKFYGHSIGPEYGVSVSEQYFADVDETTTPYADIINAAAFLGIVEGYEKRPYFLQRDLPYFKPNQAITVAEAITMLLRPQGYDRYAYYNGGYPDGYMAAAAQYNLLSSVQADDSLTREQAVELLIRALPVYSLTAVNSIDQPKYVIADGTETLVTAQGQSVQMGMNQTYPTFMTAETSRLRHIHREMHHENPFGDGEPWFLLDDTNRVVLSCANFQQVQAADESYTVTLLLPAAVQDYMAEGQDIKFVKDLWLCYRGPLSEVYDAQRGMCSFVVAR